MPLDKYYGGKGKAVMAHMKEQYGEEAGERIFYATAKKRKKTKRHSAPSSERFDQLSAVMRKE